MKWFTALLFGAAIGFVGPMLGGGRDGVWMNSVMKTGTIVPFETSPGLLFSIPVAIGAAFLLRMAFNWHSN